MARSKQSMGSDERSGKFGAIARACRLAGRPSRTSSLRKPIVSARETLAGTRDSLTSSREGRSTPAGGRWRGGEMPGAGATRLASTSGWSLAANAARAAARRGLHGSPEPGVGLRLAPPFVLLARLGFEHKTARPRVHQLRLRLKHGGPGQSLFGGALTQVPKTAHSIASDTGRTSGSREGSGFRALGRSASHILGSFGGVGSQGRGTVG